MSIAVSYFLVSRQIRSFSLYEKLISSRSLDTKSSPIPPFNIEYYEQIYEIIDRAKSIDLDQYDGQPVLYMFVIDKLVKDYEHQILCKVGFTTDIKQRYGSLKREYDCNFYLFDILRIKSISIEHNLHYHLKYVYPQLFVDRVINGVKRKEVYITSQQIHFELYKFTDNVPLYLSKYELN